MTLEPFQRMRAASLRWLLLHSSLHTVESHITGLMSVVFNSSLAYVSVYRCTQRPADIASLILTLWIPSSIGHDDCLTVAKYAVTAPTSKALWSEQSPAPSTGIRCPFILQVGHSGPRPASGWDMRLMPSVQTPWWIQQRQLTGPRPCIIPVLVYCHKSYKTSRQNPNLPVHHLCIQAASPCKNEAQAKTPALTATPTSARCVN